MSKTIFEKGAPGRIGISLPKSKTENRNTFVPEYLKRREAAKLPEVTEPEAVRHYIELSTKNFHVDKGFYPLGSCTMKYNPKINEELAMLKGFTDIHPEQPEESVQGAMEVYYEMEQMLAEISGLSAVCLQPAAGAHGELTGMLVMRAYHAKKNNRKYKVLIPDSAHGTNPASAALAGYEVVQIASGADGRIDIDDLSQKIGEDVAGIMITNPNTLGLYEKRISEVAEIIHSVDGIVYMDGANFNAILGIIRPGELGADIVHFNLHKTFSTPHGGGGPGAGPIGVSEKLVSFLPVPRIRKKDNGSFSWDWNMPDSIGKVHGYYGNFLVLVKAYVYLLMTGKELLSQISKDAILNANYLLYLVKNKWELPYPGPVAHEFVLSGKKLRQHNIKTFDVAKRLIDMGYHPPTIYFPLIVSEAIMIEPTETETKETLEEFASALNNIADEAVDNPDKLHNAPVNSPVERLDEVKAVKELKIKADLK